MSPNKTRKQIAKDAIKRAWESGDFIGILKAGLDYFLTLSFERPLRFQTFLENTGTFFDNLIKKAMEEKQLKYIGGNLVLEADDTPTIRLTAKLYFQNQNQNWVLQQAEGKIDCNGFSDWDTAPELLLLREAKKIEFPIEPPIK